MRRRDFLTGAAAAITYECPATLEVTPTVAAVPKGWSAVPGETRFQFENISIYDGHPKGLASLVPDKNVGASKSERTGVAEWRFPGGAHDVWLGCNYSGTRSSVAIRVPDGMQRCSVTARRERWGWQHDRKLTCD